MFATELPQITLVVGPAVCSISVVQAGEPTWQQDLPLGTDMLVHAALHHAPPRPMEMEHAIELTEDVVMPLSKLVGTGNELQLQGPAAQQVAVVLGESQTRTQAVVLTLEQVEALFNRLVQRSEGLPQTQDAVPCDPHFYAAMVVLREVMHHLRFSRVTL